MNNPLGIHAFTWSSPWNMDDGCRAIERAAALGYDIIAVPLRNMEEVNPAVVSKVLETNGIGVRGALGLSTDADIASADRETAERGKQRIMNAISMARDLGAQQMGGVIYSALTKYTVAPTSEGRAHCIDILGDCAVAAKEAGIVLTIEPINRYETNLINTAAQGVALIEEIGADNIVLHLDTFHMNIEENDVAEAIRVAGPKLGYFEVSESHRGYLGSGQVNFEPAFRTLVEIGYSGAIGFEAFTSNRALPQLAGIMSLWRPLWEDADDIAAHARDYIRTQMSAARQAARTSIRTTGA